MIKVINYEGKAFILPVSTTLTEKLNSDSELRFEFYATDKLRDVAQAIAGKWIVTHIGGATDEHQYVVTIVQRDSNAATTKVSVCLLYTSPSPRDKARSRMPSSA